MSLQQNDFFSFQRRMLSSLILGLIFCTVNAQNMNFVEERPMETFPVTAGAPRFVIDLDYPQAFEVTIKSYNGNESSTGFCDTFPSQIAGKIEWVGPINMTRDEVDDSGLNEKHSYDNIEFYNGYYFILDSLTFQITAIKDFNDQASYITIESEYQNQDDDEQLEDTYLILNPDQKFLYIITRKNLLSYSLTAFMDAVKNNKPIPKIKNEFPDFKPFDMILSIRYHKRRLYIVADTNVQVYVISKEGQIAEEIKLNSTFFETPEISISDIAFKGNYAYVLDKLRGVYVVDISKADTANATLETKFQFQPDGTREVQKGQFIEIVGDSLHVISSETKTPFVFEYIIRGDPVFLSLEFNRKIEIFQSVRDTFTDSNYLYLLTGFFNMATKHSIPGRYHSPKVEDYLVEYWPVLGAKALVSRVIGTTSKVAVLHGDVVTVINFEEKNPYISCNTAGVEEGFYVYELNAVQKDCDQERNSTTADYNSVCEIKQKVQLFMIKDTEIVTPVATKQTVTLLYVGIGVMGVLVIVFVCLFRKYRSQYKVLEDKIKFHKLDEDNTDQNLAGKIASGRKDNVDSQNDINPYSINIQAELKKEEEKERQKALSKSPQKSPQKPSETEKPNAEFGDIKPLDIEEIYGRKGKASQDDSD